MTDVALPNKEATIPNLRELVKDFYQSSAHKRFSDTSIEKILSLYSADRVYIYDIRNDELSHSTFYECCAPEILPRAGLIQSIHIEALTDLCQHVLTQKTVYFQLEQDKSIIHEDLVNYFTVGNVSSFFFIPAIYSGDFEGFLLIDNPKRNLENINYIFLAAAGIYGEISHERDKKAVQWQRERTIINRELRLRSIEEAFSNQTLSILRAVTDEFVCLIDVNVDTEKETRFFLHSAENADLPSWSEEEDFPIAIVEYARKLIVPEDQERFISNTRLEVLKEYLAHNREFLIEYDVILAGTRHNFQGRFTMNKSEGASPHIFIGIRDITKEKLRNQELLAAQEAAKRDPLTHLLNKKAFYELLEQYAQTGNVALAIFDIDQFKDVNDSYGHLIGDVIIERVAKSLNNSFSATDIVGRIGGDEFAVIMPNLSSEERHVIVHRLKYLKAQLQSYHDEYPQITLSIGISFLDGGEAKDFKDFLNEADKALYFVKNSGRNNYKFYN